MASTVKYYGWLGLDGYNGLVKVENNSAAYIYDRKKKTFRRDDKYIKAAIDPGSEFDEISEKAAKDLMQRLSK